MSNPFQKASKKQARLRMAIAGPAGSGKTFTALKVATAIGKTALIDTERGSASKYADLFNFDVLELDTFEPEKYIQAIRAAGEAGYEVVVIDSLSHAWAGKGGILEFVDSKAGNGNSFAAWRFATPKHNALVDAMLGASTHVIATMRSKTEYVQQMGANGKTEIKKMGMAPVQRDGVEYEFDVVGDMDDSNTLRIGKSRCIPLAGQVIEKPSEELAHTLIEWLSDGAPSPSLMRGRWLDEFRALKAEEGITNDEIAALLGESTPNAVFDWLSAEEDRTPASLVLAILATRPQPEVPAEQPALT